DQQIKLSNLAKNDALLVNLASGSATSSSPCTDIWVGAETHKQVAAKQRERYAARLKERGAPAWVENVDGRKITIAFFAGVRKDFTDVLNGEPWGKGVAVTLADDALQPQGATFKAGFANNLPEVDTFEAYGATDRRWVIETVKPENYVKGQPLRVFKEEWSAPTTTK
ncbi:MAG TPA: hypothetical protein VHX44_07145, partial [Planctomycetota bacterium]|nr:hypothetical protein [Planctomycetota bacterium]